MWKALWVNEQFRLGHRMIPLYTIDNGAYDEDVSSNFQNAKEHVAAATHQPGGCLRLKHTSNFTLLPLIYSTVST